MNNVLLKKISKAVVKEMQALEEAEINTISHKLTTKLKSIDDPKQREEFIISFFKILKSGEGYEQLFPTWPKMSDEKKKAFIEAGKKFDPNRGNAKEFAQKIIAATTPKEIEDNTEAVVDDVEAQTGVDLDQAESDAESKEDMYDPSPEDREMLRSAYNNFKEEFYQVRKMVQQGQLIQLLINQLSKIQKEETEDSYQKVDEILNEEEKQRVKKELENVKTDFRSFYQELLSTRELLQKAGKEAKAGKLNFNLVKKEFLQQLQKIQDDILEIYSDLVNLSPPKAEVEEIPESQQFLEQEGEQEEEKDDRLSRAKKIQAVYNEITKSIGPIVNILSKGESFPESRMLPAVAKALEKLNKIVDFFPSVKAFSGQTGSFEELSQKYTEMIRNLGYLNDNFQRLIKDESVSSTAINNLYLGLKRFSKEVEDTFEVESKIIDKPKPTDPDAKADTPEAENTGSDGEDNDSDGQIDEPDEKEKKETELQSISRAETFIKNKIFPLDKYMEIFDDNPEAKGFAEDSRDVLGLFLVLSKARQEANEQEEVAMGQESLSRVITLLSKIFNVPKTKTEYIINQQLRKIVPNKLKTLSQFLTMVRKEGKKSEFVRLARFIQNRIKAFPFTVTADPSQLMRKFDIEDSKTKPQKKKEKSDTLAQRTVKARGKKQTSGKYDFGGLPATDYPGLPYGENKEQKLSKLLKPLIEKILREQ